MIRDAAAGRIGDLAGCIRRAAAEHGARTGELPRVEETPSGMVRAYGPRSSALGRASDGLADVRELSYAAAEHHPFWPLLYHAADIAQAVLDRWDGGRRLDADAISEMRWSLGAMSDALDRLSSCATETGAAGNPQRGASGRDGDDPAQPDL